jgi:hypothetical protein
MKRDNSDIMMIIHLIQVRLQGRRDSEGDDNGIPYILCAQASVSTLAPFPLAPLLRSLNHSFDGKSFSFL